MDIGGWLRSLGLEQYEAAFHANAVDADVLRDLTDQDLKKLGVLLSHRRKLLRAIAALDNALAPASTPRPTPLPIEAILAVAAAAASPECRRGEDHSVSPSPQPSPMSSRLRPAEMIGDRFLPSPEDRRCCSPRPMIATMTIYRQPRQAKPTAPMIVTMISRARAGGIVSS
jgi:hypothetical protein